MPLVDPSTGLPTTVTDVALHGPSSAAQRSAREPSRGGGAKIILVFLLVFVLSVAGVGALLRFGVIHLR